MPSNGWAATDPGDPIAESRVARPNIGAEALAVVLGADQGMGAGPGAGAWATAIPSTLTGGCPCTTA